MATLSTNALTLVDWAKRIDPDGKTSTVAEVLNQTNEILNDALFMEGNLPTGHRAVIRTGLPAVYYRALNQGVPASKSTSAQVDEGCSILEARSEIDVDLVSLNGNTAEFRFSEDIPFIEAMNQTQATGMFYGNPGVDPKQYLGLAPRYSLKSAPNGQNILDAGGVGSNNTSIYLVVWGANTVFCPFPKGSKAGLEHQDLGEQTIFDSPNNTRMQALATRYVWKNGLVVKDWRYVVRICNIDTAALIAQTGTQAVTAATNVVKMMMRARARIPNLGMGKAAYYMNRTAFSGLGITALDRTQSVLNIKDGATQFGTTGAPGTMLDFLGIPIRNVDALLNTEARVL
jgi:hypothetical protein